MSKQILEQITAEESFNTRRFDLKIFISCTKLKGNATYIEQLRKRLTRHKAAVKKCDNKNGIGDSLYAPGSLDTK